MLNWNYCWFKHRLKFHIYAIYNLTVWYTYRKPELPMPQIANSQQPRKLTFAWININSVYCISPFFFVRKGSVLSLDLLRAKVTLPFSKAHAKLIFTANFTYSRDGDAHDPDLIRDKIPSTVSLLGHSFETHLGKSVRLRFRALYSTSWLPWILARPRRRNPLSFSPLDRRIWCTGRRMYWLWRILWRPGSPTPYCVTPTSWQCCSVKKLEMKNWMLVKQWKEFV